MFRDGITFSRTAWRAGPGAAVATVAGIAVSTAAPLAVMLAIGSLITTASTAASQGIDSAAGRSAQWGAVLVGALSLVQWSAGTFRSTAATALGERVDSLLQRDLMDAVLAPRGITHLEDPKTLGLIAVGRDTFRDSWGRPGRLVSTLGGLVTARLVLIGSSVTAARFNPLLGLGLLVAGTWVAHEELSASRAEAAHHYGTTETARRVSYFSDLGTTPGAAKEVRVFGLSGFILDSYAQTWRASMTAVLRRAPRRPLAATAALTVVVLGGLSWIAYRASSGAISAGAAAVYAQALVIGLAGVQQASWTGLQTELAMATLRRFQEAVAAVRRSGAASMPAPAAVATPSIVDSPREAVVFDDVSFCYPGGKAALNGLSLTIPAGGSLAIVGANGAGKTTLVKLLCGMYEPTAGRILVDGADLSSIDPVVWRRRLTAVFQDSVHLPLSVRETIVAGHKGVADIQAGMEEAVHDADVAADIATLPGRWDTPLSADLTGGVDLSGGQWQKIALARALFAVRRGARVLILDEPAAHLDARAEARLHRDFLKLTAGVTTVVISHRFSTVRQASSIAVLDDGRVVEQGTHDELVALEGRYAHMYHLQASRFAPPVADQADGAAEDATEAEHDSGIERETGARR